LVKNFAYKRYCNPGSVGQPRDGDARASFAVLTGDSFEIHRVEYDIEKVAKSMESLGFDDYLVGGLFTGSARLQARSVGDLE
jgi:diadenosine tetraphosphatase ApaH/serine/threonine PP2A family protein phosphatase